MFMASNTNITQDCDGSSNNGTISDINGVQKDMQNLNDISEFNLINIILCLTFQEKLQFIHINKRFREVLYHHLCFPNVSLSPTTDQLTSPQLIYESSI